MTIDVAALCGFGQGDVAMSASGHSRRFRDVRVTSAIPPSLQ